MRFGEKLLILCVAICVSVLGFNLIASSSVCLLTTAKDAGYEPIRNYYAKCYTNLSSAGFSAHTVKQLKSSSTYLQLTHAKRSLLEETRHNSSRKIQDR